MKSRPVSLVFMLCSLILSIHLLAKPKTSGSGGPPKNIQTTGYLYGLGLMARSQIYKGKDISLIPLPLLGYMGERFQFYGPLMSYRLYNQSDVNISVKANIIFPGYEESDHEIFSGLGDRKFSFNAGVQLGYKINKWGFNLSADHDLLKRSNGYQLTSKVSKSIRKGPFFFDPSISLNYWNNDWCNYYYGVKPSQVSENRSVYQVDGAFNWKFGFSFATPIFFGGMTRLNLDYQIYDDAIADSPLTNSRASAGMMLTFSKFF